MLEKDAYSVVSDILKPESFYNPVHNIIFGAIQGLAVQQKPVDVLTVVEELKRRGELPAAGGAVYIAELSEKVASAAHIEYHSRIIAQKFLARELITFSSDVTQQAFDETIDVDDLMQETEGRLFEISQRNVKKDVIQINPVIKEAMKIIQLAANRKDGMSGIPTGFNQLDKLTMADAAMPGAVTRSRPTPAALLELHTLQALDAALAGASLRETAAGLFGDEAVATSWYADGGLRSRVRRLVRRGQSLMRGGYRRLAQLD